MRTRFRALRRSWPVQLLTWTLTALVVIPGLLYAAPMLTGSDGAYLVLSGSMVPFFDPGDIIFVSEVPTDSLQVGDVVTFQVKPGSKTLITHRVIEILDDGGTIRYRTQGDANEDPDPFVVRQDTIVGTYDFQIPYWGLMLQVLKSKLGYVLFVLLPGGIIVLREFVKLYHELDAADRAKKAAREARKEPA